MLYDPWYDKEAFLLGGYAIYEEHYWNMKDVLHDNEFT